MNIEQLREELKTDEGVKYEVYLDHLGLPTCVPTSNPYSGS